MPVVSLPCMKKPVHMCMLIYVHITGVYGILVHAQHIAHQEVEVVWTGISIFGH